MKPKLIFCLALVLSGVLMGCHGIGTQRFTAFAPAQSPQLENSSRIVLDVVPEIKMVKADYNLRENLSMLAPKPKHWKADMTLMVQRVVKGEFSEKTIELHDLRSPTKEQADLLGISSAAMFNFTNRILLRIGFDDYSDGHFENLKIIKP
jgi:hypothetical protein